MSEMKVRRYSTTIHQWAHRGTKDGLLAAYIKYAVVPIDTPDDEHPCVVREFAMQYRHTMFTDFVDEVMAVSDEELLTSKAYTEREKLTGKLIHEVGPAEEDKEKSTPV